jgi:predicted transcriptional regulator
MKTLLVGIASYKTMKKRTLEIARGESRVRRDEPKVWFTSVESFAKVLSDRNRTLMELIRAHNPESLAELAELSGRKKSNLSRTLRTMAHYGLVSLKEGPRGSVIPRVPYSRIELNLSLAQASKTISKNGSIQAVAGGRR